MIRKGISDKYALHTTVLFLLVLLAVLTRQFWKDSSSEIWISSILITAAGIPHGALDHIVARHNRQEFHLATYIMLYVFYAAVYLICWQFAPGLAFLTFLLITAWHFGETDFTCFLGKKGAGLSSFLYGIATTMWLLMQDKPVLMHWTSLMTTDNSTALFVVSAIADVPLYIWFSILSALLLLNGDRLGENFIRKLIFLLFLFLLSYTSLLVGFILYFTGWHSVNALMHIKGSVFQETDGGLMIEKAIPATLSAISFLVIMGFMSNGVWLERFGLPALFILLSILTLPHMIEMHRLYKHEEGLNR